MVFLEQKNIADQISGPFGWIGKMLLPTVETASENAHGFAEQFYRERSGQFHDHLVFLLPYRITVPSPFTSYPFFSRASVIRAFTSSWINCSFVMDSRSSIPAGAVLKEGTEIALLPRFGGR